MPSSRTYPRPPKRRQEPPKKVPTTDGWKRQRMKKKPNNNICTWCGIDHTLEIEFDGIKLIKKASAVLGTVFVVYKLINKIRK